MARIKRKNIILNVLALGYIVVLIFLNLIMLITASSLGFSSTNLVILIVFILVADLIFIILYVLFKREWNSKTYHLYKDRIVIESGYLHGTEEIIDIAQATVVDVEQGMMGKLLGFGSITIISRNGIRVATLDGVSDPEKIARIIEKNYEDDKNKRI